MTSVEPGRGRTVLERHPIRVEGLERQGFVQRLSKNDLFRPLGEGPGGHGESTHDVDHDRHGRGFDQISDAEETSVHPVMIAHALPKRIQSLMRITRNATPPVACVATSKAVRNDMPAQSPHRVTRARRVRTQAAARWERDDRAGDGLARRSIISSRGAVALRRWVNRGREGRQGPSVP